MCPSHGFKENRFNPIENNNNFEVGIQFLLKNGIGKGV